MVNTDTIERFSQPAEVEATLNRTRYTIACQKNIAAEWVWPELSTVAWHALLDAVIHPQTGLRHLLLQRDTDRDLAEANLRAHQKNLHDATVASLGIARIRWRGQPERRLVFAQLSALGRTVEETLEEAELWESAWEEIDPAFVAGEGLTLATLTALRAEVLAAVSASRSARIRRTAAAGALAVAVLQLDDLAQAWYAEATSVFPDASQGMGEQIRSIPTTYVPRYADAAKKRRAAKRAAAAVV